MRHIRVFVRVVKASYRYAIARILLESKAHELWDCELVLMYQVFGEIPFIGEFARRSPGRI